MASPEIEEWREVEIGPGLAVFTRDMSPAEIDAASDWVRAQELDYILSDVLEALDQVEFLVAEGRLSEYALGQADLAARVRSLIEDGDQ